MIIFKGTIDPSSINGHYDPSTQTLTCHDHIELHPGYTFSKPVKALIPGGDYNITIRGSVTVSQNLGGTDHPWNTVFIGSAPEWVDC